MNAQPEAPAGASHEGHNVHPHDHSGQSLEHRKADWCSGRWCCVTCASRDLPRGVWFDGPECPRPKAKAAA